MQWLKRAGRARSFTWVLFVLTAMPLHTAFADCAVLGRAASEVDGRLSVAMEGYKSAVATVAQITDTKERIAKALAASSKLLELISGSIVSLERGEAEGCFGKQAGAWREILKGLKAKQEEFGREHEALLKAAAQVRRPSKADWVQFLTPSIAAFSACMVQTKRRALASNGQKPTPQDFTLIIRGACNTEAVAVEAEEDKIDGWTREKRKEISDGLSAMRSRAISEYAEGFYGLR